MFNLSGSEIVVILLLALVVLGPEKLPDAIRRAGRTYAELKKMGNSFQAEMKSVLDEPMKEMRETADLLKKSMDFTDGELTGEADDAAAARRRRRRRRRPPRRRPTAATADDAADDGADRRGRSGAAHRRPTRVDDAVPADADAGRRRRAQPGRRADQPHVERRGVRRHPAGRRAPNHRPS